MAMIVVDVVNLELHNISPVEINTPTAQENWDKIKGSLLKSRTFQQTKERIKKCGSVSKVST